MKTTFIYTLSCPITGDVRYVGKSNNPRQRYSKHNKICDTNHSKNEWIRSLHDLNLKPILTIIDELEVSQWKVMEKFYIRKYKDLGCNLVNISGGANGSDFGNKTSFDGRNARKIVCLYKNGEYKTTFNSILDAKKYVGCNRSNSNINSVLKGKTKTAYEYIWIYEDLYRKLTNIELDIFIKNSNNNMSKSSWKNGLIDHQFKKGQVSMNRKKVYQYTIDDLFIREWDSVEEASKSLSGSKNTKISMCAAGKRKKALGYKWYYFKK